MSGYGMKDMGWTESQRQSALERLRKQDEERARDRAAWNRLCGMVSPIGGPVDL